MIDVLIMFGYFKLKQNLFKKLTVRQELNRSVDRIVIFVCKKTHKSSTYFLMSLWVLKLPDNCNKLFFTFVCDQIVKSR